MIRLLFLGALFSTSLFATTICDRVFQVEASHVAIFHDPSLRPQLHADGDLVLVLGEEMAQTWFPRGQNESSILPTPYLSPRLGSIAVSRSGGSALLVEDRGENSAIHDVNLSDGVITRTEDWPKTNGVPHLVHDRLALVNPPSGNLELWDPVSQSKKSDLSLPAPGFIDEVISSNSKNIFAVKFRGEPAQGWIVSAETGATLFQIPLGWNRLAISPQEKTVIHSLKDGFVTWQNISRGARLGLIDTGTTSPIRDLHFIDELHALTSQGSRIRVWELEVAQLQSSNQLKSIVNMDVENDMISTAVVSPDRRWIATAHSNGEVIVWDRATFTPVAELSGHSVSVYSVQFSEDGSTILTADIGNELRHWDLDTRLKGDPTKSEWKTDVGRLQIRRENTPEGIQVRIEGKRWL